MYPMPGTPAEDESGTSDIERENIQSSEWATWFIRFATVAYAGSIFVRMWNDEEIRLYMLHGLTRMLGNTARMFGMLAIRSEKAYYRVVDTIPH